MSALRLVRAAVAALGALALFAAPAAWAQSCATAPGGGDVNTAVSGIVNTYWAGSGTSSAGSTSVNVGAVRAAGPGTTIAVGDLILIIQMQDAFISTSNDANYGGSGSGAGYTSINRAGKYEYAVATGPIAAGSVPLASGLLNTYTQAAANSTTGQRTYQVIRVPQYSSATITGTVTAPVWDGTTGGVVAFDTAGVLNWGGQTIDVNGRGFRGGGGQQSGSDATGAPVNQITDYVSNVGAGTLGGTANGSVPNGVKGEGTAGTPIIVFTPTTPWDNTAGTNTNTGGTDGTTGGYPAGSLGRGAPGNGGGGGTDGEVANNQQNTGGAGGGNYGPGGKGGFGWTPGTPPGHDGGGMGGAAMPVAPDRLFLGGGGGAASNNNGTGTPTFGRASSGGAGGGIVFVRAGTTTGAGSITARGTSANSSVLNDASGGGGAGGTALVFIDNGGAATGVSIDLRGGDGGSNTPGAGANCPHGPGGGGSGGYAAVSGTTSVNVAGGIAGLTCANAFTPQQYGSTASVGGFSVVNLGPGQIPGAGSGNACFPQLTVAKSTSTPYVSAGGTATWTILVSNAAGKSTATGVAISDALPANPNITYATTPTVTLGGGATRTPVTNPTAGTATPAWSTFSIPGGGSVALTFTANVAAAVASGTYQNPANVTYLDPTRVTGSPLITPGGTYAAGGTVPGSNYVAASTTNEDVYVVNPPPTFTKTFTPAAVAPGSTSVLTIVFTNPSPVALTNAAFTDTYPAGLVNSAAPNGTLTGAGCLGTVVAAANGPGIALSGGTIPVGGTCTITANVTVTANGTYTNTIPVGALTSTQNITNTTAGSAILSTAITVAKSFVPTAVAPGAASNLRLVITNPNSVAVTLANPALTDNFPPLMRAVGGAVTVTGTCTGFAPTTIAANATSFAITAGTIPANTSCTVSFDVYSNTAGIYNNTTTGITTTSPAVTGPPSNTASLGVGLITIAKNFSPATIQSGGTSTITYTLANPTGVAQTAGAFLDTMLNMQAVGGAVGGSCTGTLPANFAAGATTFSFTGINIPAGAPTGSCTVTVDVTSSTVGTNPNAANGVTTALLPQGPGSNTDNLIVVGKPTIAKAFAPTRIAPSGTSTITFTLTNPNTIALTAAAFSDALPANLSISGAQSAGGSCTGAGTNNFAAGQTGTLNFSGLTLPVSTSCTVTVIVTGTVLGSYNNTSSGVTSTESGTAGAVSNTANLVIASPPTISKAFGTSPIIQGGTSVITFSVANPNVGAVTGLNFTDALTGMSVQNTTIGGTCVGVSNAPALAVGATSLNLTIPTLAGGASCTITITVGGSVSGTFPNTTSGVISNETARGPASNTANLVVLSPPTVAKAFVSSSIESGGTANIVFTITNPNATTALTGISFSDTLTNMSLAAGTALTTTCGAGTASGTGVAAASTSFTVSLTTLAGGATCTITVSNVTSTVVSPAGGHPNTTSTVASNEANVNRGAAATGYLNVYAPPTVTKSFSPNGIASGGTSVVTFTITNPNANPLTDVRFTDDLPANLLNSAAQSYIGAGRGTCTGTIPSAKAAGNVDPVNFTSTTVPANSSCTIMMDVTSSTVGSYTNTATLVRSNQTPTNTTGGSDVLSVGRVAVSKSFRAGAPGSGAAVVTDIPLNTVFWLWVDMTNQSGGTRSAMILTDNWAASATGVTVDNGTAPAGQSLAVSTSGTCTGLAPATITEGSTSYTTTALSLASGVTCVVGFPLIATTAGTKSNTATTTCAPANALCNNNDTATIRAWAPPTIAKAFAPATIGAGSTSTVTVTLTNPAANTGPLTGAAFTDTLTNMAISANQTVGGTCPGITPSTLTAGATALSFSGITIPAGGSCTVTFVVTSTTTGTLPNTASGVTTTQSPTAGANSGAVNLTVVGSTLTKAFSPASITAGTQSQLTFTITNGAGTPAQSPLAFTETLPTNVVVDATPNAVTTCTGGTVSATAGSGTIALSGASFAAGGTTCTVTVNVTSSVAGAYNNTSTNISGLSPGLSAAGLSATLTVVAAPALTKAFAPASIAPGTTSVLTFTLTNGAGNGAKSGLAFTDTLPANVVVAAAPGVTTNCPAGGGFAAPAGPMAVTAAAGSGSVAVTGAAFNNAVAACQVRVNVTANAVGNYTNNSTNISALAGGLTAGGVNATLSAVGTALTKSFTPTVIGKNGVSTMTFTIANGAGNPAQSGLQFTENLPANVFVAAAPNVTNACGGTVTAVAGAGTIPFSGGSIAAASASCSFSVDVTSAFVSSYLNNAARIVSPPATMDTSGVNATLTVLENPAVAKAFAPNSIPASGTSTLTITLSNTNTAAITGVAFTDSLPAALATVAATAATTCGGTASQAVGSVSLAGGTIPATGSCTVTVNVTGTTVGTHTNTIAIGGVTSTNAGANSVAGSANLSIVARPTVAKAFAPAQIGIGGTATLTITLANANAGLTITDAAFTDTLPANVTTVAATAATTCGGTASQTAGTVSLAAGSIPAAGSCTVTVNVTSSTVGSYTNTIAAGDLTSTNAGTNAAPASANLAVLLAPTTVKAFTPASIFPGATSVLSIAITNPNAVALTGVAFTDSYGATPIVNTAAASGALVGAGCTGTVTAANNGTSVALSGGGIPASSTCTVTVNVTANTVGVHANTTGAISTTNAGNGTAAAANLTVVGGLTGSKAFSPATIQAGQASTLTITLTNPNTTTTVTGIAFTDTYPVGAIVNTGTPGGGTTCTSGSVTAAAGGGSVALSGAQLAAGASCTVTVQVTSNTASAAGGHLNSIGNVTAANAPTNAGGTANLVVFAAPTLAKTFGAANIASGGTTTLTLAVTNPAANSASVSGITVRDVFPTTPGAMTLANTTVVNGCAASTVTDQSGAAIAIGSTGVRVTGINVAPGATCSIQFNVTAANAGSYSNTTDAITATAPVAITGATANATLGVLAAPTFSKAFAPTTIGPGGTSTLTFTLVNPAANAQALTGVAFNDTFPVAPGAMVVAGTPSASTSGCGAATFAPVAGAASIAFSTGTIAAGATCTVSVNVTAPAAGTYNNTSGTVSTTGPAAVTGTTAAASLTVTQPSLTKAFTSPVDVNQDSTLTFTLTNGAGNPAQSGINVTDNLPANVVVAPTPAIASTCPSGAGVVTAAAGATSIQVTGASMSNAQGSCTISVAVRSAIAGTYTNTDAANISGQQRLTTTGVNASLVVQPQPLLTKAFAVANVGLGQTTTLTFSLANTAAGAVARAGVSFTDTLPAGIAVANPAAPTSSNCGAPTFTAVDGTQPFTASTVSIAAGATCSITLTVRGTALGAAVNGAGQITAISGAINNVTNQTLTVVQPALTKAFTSPVDVNQDSTLTFTLANGTGNPAQSGINFTDNLPTNVVVSPTPAIASSCPSGTGVVTAAAGATSIQVTGASMNNAQAACTISVNVRSATAGTYTNTNAANIAGTARITTTGVNASLVVQPVPALTKAFAAANVGIGQTTALTFTIPNTAAGAVARAGISFTDTLPAGIAIANPAAPSSSNCGAPAFTAVDGTQPFTASGISIAAGATCTVTMTVRGTALGAAVNGSGQITAINGATNGVANQTLTVVQPALTKAFTSPVDVNQDSTLTFTLTNGAGNPAQSGINFTDNLPANVVVAPTPAIASTCPSGTGVVTAAAGATSIQVTGASMSNAQASCTFSVNVRSAIAGTYTNTDAANITGTQRVTTTGVNASLVVQPIAALTKAFAAANVGLGQATTLTFSIANTAAGAVARAGISFTDTLPAGIVVANPAAPASSNCGAPAFTAVDGTQPFTASGISVAAGATCSITMSVRGTVLGAAVNGSGQITAISGAANGVTNQTLTVVQPSLTKSFTSPVDVNQDSTLTFTLTNGTGNPAQGGINFTDNLAAGVVVSPTPAIASTCPSGTGVVTAAAGATSIQVAGASMSNAQASCTISVAVRSAVAGTYTNTDAANITGTQRVTTTGVNASLVVQPIPALTKAFAAANVGLGQTTTLTFSLANTAAGAVARAGVSFTDTLPAGIAIANPAAPTSGSCGAPAFTAVDGTQPFTAAGISIAAGATCSITVTVRGTALGAAVNGAGQITAINGAANGVTNQTLTVVQPALTKAFTSPVDVNQDSTLTFTLANGAGNPAQSGINFTDTLAAGLVVSPAPAIASTCPSGTGVVTAAAGTGTITVTSATMGAALASCTISVAVRSAVAGTYTNTDAANISGQQRVTTTGVNASLVVQPQPALTKAFAAANVGLGQTTTLTFSLANTAAGAIARAGVSFTDTLPAGIVVANPAAPTSSNCGAPTFTAVDGTQPFTAATVSIAAGATCSITLTVRGTVLGAAVNGAGQITAINGAINNVTNQTLTVVQAALTKAFTTPVDVNQDSTLTFTLANGTGNPAQSGINFTDNLPTNVVVSPTPAIASSCPSGTGVVTAAAGATSIQVTGASMNNAQAACTISVNVRSATAGTYTNTDAANIVGTQRITTTGVSATLAVQALPTLTKAFNPTTAGVGLPSALVFTITNPAGAPARGGLGLVDNLPAGLLVATPNGAATTCPGAPPAITATSGSGTITVTGANVAAGASSCTLTVNVSAAATGAYVNDSTNVTPTGLNNGVTAQTLTVVRASLDKAFSPTTINVGQTSTLTFTLTNGAGNPAQSGISFSDSLPGNVVVAATPNVQTNCPAGAGFGAPGFTVTAGAGATSASFSSVTMASGVASCQVRVDVTSNVAGSYTNNSANVTAAGITNSVTPSTLTVNAAPPTITKAFTPATIASGATSTLTITIANANSVPITVTSVTDTFPVTPGTGLVRAATPAASTTCASGSVTHTAGSVTLTGGTVPANGSCSFRIDVQAANAGTYTNTIAAGALTSTAGANTAPASANLVVTPVANLAVVKSGPATVGYGSTATYTIVVSNTGPDAANGASFSDTVPAKLGSVAGSCGSPTGGATCGAVNVAGNAVTSTITTLPVGGSVTFTVSGVAIDTGSFTNTATVAPPAGTTDPVAANDSSSVTTTILAPDLTIAKTHAGSFTIGTNGTYTITVSDAGTLATSGTITVTDTLPTGLGFVSASGTGWACANAAGTVTCTTSNAINPAASAPAITLVVSVASVAAPSVTNFASVSGGNEPPALATNNQASDNTIVVAAAVNTFVPSGAQTAMPGTVVFYPHTFTAGLAGSVSFATSAIITPPTPGWTQLIYRDSNCNGVLDGVEGNVQLTTPVAVVPGDMVCIVVKDSIPATAPYNSLNRITVTATFGAQTLTVQDVTTVGAVAGAGLTLAKSVRNVTQGGAAGTSGTARPNDVLEYTITYTNTSPGLLSAIVVTDPTPAFTLFVSAACPAPPPNLTSCTVTASPAVGGTGSVVWTLGGALLSNGSGNVSYQVRVAP